MLTLCIVGCGKDIQDFASALRDELRVFVKQHNGHVYNLNTLWKAEVCPELLTRNARLTFSKKAFDSEYVGAINIKDYDELHSRWFSSLTNSEAVFAKPTYYTKSRLIAWIKNLYKLPKMKNHRNPFDFEISYHYEKISESDELCIVEWRLNDVLEDLNPFDIFLEFISKLDLNFPNIFASAYIKDSISDELPSVQFDRELLGLRVLDGGYAYYICDQIKAFHGISSADNSNVYIENALSGGTLYVFNGNPDEFNYNFHLCNLSVLEKTLIPHYVVLNWSNLSEEKLSSLPFFDTISVYYDKYFPTDPTIVFSFQYTYSQLDDLPSLVGLVCQERYNKDFLIHIYEANI